MKYLVLILSFMFSIGVINAQNNAQTSQKIKFTKTEHDFGSQAQGKPVTYEFEFTNVGKEPLIISSAKGRCGCTVPTWPKEPIMKGETAVIKVHYDTKRVGAFTKTVTINSNAKSDTKVLTIKGVVEAVPESTDQTMPLKNSSGPMENVK